MNELINHLDSLSINHLMSEEISQSSIHIDKSISQATNKSINESVIPQID